MLLIKLLSQITTLITILILTELESILYFNHLSLSFTNSRIRLFKLILKLANLSFKLTNGLHMLLLS